MPESIRNYNIFGWSEETSKWNISLNISPFKWQSINKRTYIFLETIKLKNIYYNATDTAADMCDNVNAGECGKK